MYTVLYPYADFVFSTIKNQRIVPGWNPYLFCGFPMIGASHSGIFYPFNLIFNLIFRNTYDAYTYLIIFHTFIMLLFSYFAICLLSVSRKAALFGAIAYTFSGFMVSHNFNLSIVSARAWVPLFFWCFLNFKNTLKLKYIVIGSFCIFLQFLCGHPQEIFIELVFVSILSFFYFLYSPQKIKTIGICIVFCVFTAIAGICFSAFQILPTKEYSSQSARVKADLYEYLTVRSMPPYQIISLFFPNYAGNPADNSYIAAEGYDEFTIYIGVIAIALAAAALSNWKFDVTIRILFWILSIHLIFAVGHFTPLYKFLIHIPGFNIFRAPARFLHIFVFCAAALAAKGFDYALIKKNISSMKWLRRFLFSSILLLLILNCMFVFIDIKKIINIIFSNISDKDGLLNFIILKFSAGVRRVGIEYYIFKIARLYYTYSVNLPFFFVIYIISYCLIFQKFILKKISGRTKAFFMLAILIIELFEFSRRTVPYINPDFFKYKPKTLNIISEQDKINYRFFSWNRGVMYSEFRKYAGYAHDVSPYYRVIDFIPEGQSPLFKLKGLWGYDTLVSERVSKFRNAIISGKTNLLKIAGVKYIFTCAPINGIGNPDIFENRIFIYTLNDARPIFYFANKFTLCGDSVIPAILNTAEFSAQNNIVLENFQCSTILADTISGASIDNIVLMKDDEISLSIKNPHSLPLLFVFNDCYDKEWKCSINNKPSQIFRTNYLFKSILIPSGDSKVVFYYSYQSFLKGLRISIISFIIAALIIIGFIIFNYYFISKTR